MALGDYALPIGHITSGSSQLNFCMGREYLQPVDIAQFASSHIEGLECWLENKVANRKLYAMFNGTLSYNPLDKKLVLVLSAVDSTQFNSIRGLLESVPNQVFYNYPEPNDVSQAIVDILTTEYNNSSSTHPILTNIFRSTKQSIKNYLADEDNNGNLTQAISGIANTFAAGSISLSVLAGDIIGLAGDPPVGLMLPSGCSLPPLGNNKYLFLEVFDYAGFHMDPSYYLWRFLKDEHQATNPLVQLLTNAPIRVDNTFNHPLLDSLAIDLDVERKPRAIINTTLPGQSNAQDVLLFPLEKLSTWQGAKRGTGNSTREISLIDWRISNNTNLTLELRRKPGEDSHDYKLCGETFSAISNICPNPNINSQSLLQHVWDTWGNDLNEICRILQWPVELVTSTMAHESKGNGIVNPRAVRLEPISESLKTLLSNNTNIGSTVAQNYYDLVSGSGWSTLDIGDHTTWNLTSNIPSTNPSITYGNLLDIVEIIPYRVSPGLMQTLTDKVKIHLNNWLMRDQNYNDIATVFNVDPIPTNYKDQFKWLLTGKHSILLGTVMQKWAYNKRKTKMSVFEVSAAYNAGALFNASNLSGVTNPYGFRYNGINYPIEYSLYYNTIQSLFTSGENGLNKFYKSK